MGPKKGPRRPGGGPGDRLAAAHLHSLAERADSQGRTYQDPAPLPPSPPLGPETHKSIECILRTLISSPEAARRKGHTSDFTGLYEYFPSCFPQFSFHYLSPSYARCVILFKVNPRTRVIIKNVDIEANFKSNLLEG